METWARELVSRLTASFGKVANDKGYYPLRKDQLLRKKIWKIAILLAADGKAARRKVYMGGLEPTKFWLEAPVDQLKARLVDCRALSMDSVMTDHERGQARRRVKQCIFPVYIRSFAKNRKVLRQLSFVSRSLELPTAEMVSAAKATMIERLGKPHPVKTEWLVAGLQDKIFDCPPIETSSLRSTLASASGTYDVSRRDGGRLKDWVSRTEKPYFRKSFLGVTSKRDVSVPDLVAIDPEKVTSLVKPLPTMIQPSTANDHFSSMASYYRVSGKCQLVGIREPGKVRIATKHALPDTLLADMAGAALRKVMRRLVPLRDSLLEDPSAITLRRSVLPLKETFISSEVARKFPGIKPDKLYLISTDLKSATDLISHSVVKVVADRMNLPTQAFSADYVVTSATYQFDDLSGEIQVDPELKYPVQRGTCLGLGGSWPALSLIHYVYVRSLGISDESYRIKGDDLIGLWTGRQCLIYMSNLTSYTGMEVQYSKTFISENYALYCERMFRCKKVGDLYTLVRCPNSLSLKTLSSEKKIGELVGLPASLAPEISREGRKRVLTLLNSHEMYTKVQRDFGFWCNIPVSLGGLGFILPRTRQPCPAEIHTWIRAVMTGGIRPPCLFNPDKGKSIQVLQRDYLSVHIPRRRVMLNDPWVRANENWVDFMDREIKAEGYNSFFSSSAKRLEEKEATILTDLALLGGFMGLRNTDITISSLYRMLHTMKRQAKELSARKVTNVTFQELEQVAKRSLWVEKSPTVSGLLATKASTMMSLGKKSTSSPGVPTKRPISKEI